MKYESKIWPALGGVWVGFRKDPVVLNEIVTRIYIHTYQSRC